jgi:hypothetical protein
MDPNMFMSVTNPNMVMQELLAKDLGLSIDQSYSGRYRDDEKVCPLCLGPSPTGGPCNSCLANETSVGDASSQPDSHRPVDTRLEDHHIFPRQFGERFKDVSADFDIHERTVTIYAFEHHFLHDDGFNPDWNMLFEMADVSGVKPTLQDLMDFGAYLVEKYGFSEVPQHRYKDRSGDLGPYLLQEL